MRNIERRRHAARRSTQLPRQHQSRFPTFAAGAAMFCAALASAAEPTLDVRNLMTPEEVVSSGLQKLSDSELAAPNQWLLRYTVRDAGRVRQSNPLVKAESSRAAAEIIRSRIVGQFNGWSGSTNFTLANGQQWQQRGGHRYRYEAVDPEIEITTNALGFQWLELLATGRRVPVKRVD